MSLEVEVNLVKQLGLTTTLDCLVASMKYLYSCEPAIIAGTSLEVEVNFVKQVGLQRVNDT